MIMRSCVLILISNTAWGITILQILGKCGRKKRRKKTTAKFIQGFFLPNFKGRGGSGRETGVCHVWICVLLWEREGRRQRPEGSRRRRRKKWRGRRRPDEARDGHRPRTSPHCSSLQHFNGRRRRRKRRRRRERGRKCGVAERWSGEMK